MKPEESLMHFSRAGDPDQVQAALATGANVNAVSTEGYTPLMLAVMAGNTETVARLIAAGASIFSTDSSGHTALILAAQRCRTEIVKLLIEHSRRVHPRSGPSVVSLYTANSLDSTGCSEVAHLLRTNPV